MPLSEQRKLVDQLPIHISGMLQHRITLSGNFSAQGMLDYDLPVICGPSGATAMLLAHGNQANLNDDEMALLQFAISMHHVAISAHSIDECFIVANNEKFNHYRRGDYSSIFPEVLKKDNEFTELWNKIQMLNHSYQDIMVYT